MKRFVGLLLLSLAPCLYGQTTIVGNTRIFGPTTIPLASGVSVPGLRQAVSCSINENPNQMNGAVTSIDCPLKLTTGGGNLITFEIQYQSNASVSSIIFTDNVGGNTYTLGPSCTDSTNHQTAALYYAKNIASGVQVITATMNGGTPFRVTPIVQEWFNVDTSAPFDGSGSCTATGSNITAGSAISAGSLGTLTSGDLVVYGAFAETWPIASCIAGSGQANITWVRQTCDVLDSSMVQSGVYNATASFSPKATSGTTATWLALSAAFKAANAGAGPPNGVYIVRALHNNTVNATASSIVIQTPCSGNTLALSVVTSPSYFASSISDNNGNTWKFLGSARETAWWDAESVTCNDAETLTINMSGSNSGPIGVTLVFYDMAGAATSPFDGTAGFTYAVGDQTSGSSTPFTAYNFVPTNANELVLSALGLQFDTITGVNSPSCALFTAPIYVTEPEPTHYDENNGEGVCYASTNASQTWTWQPNNQDSKPIGVWAGASVAFAPPGSGSSGPGGILRRQDAVGSVANTVVTSYLGPPVKSGNFLAGLARDGSTTCSPGGEVITITDNGSPGSTWNNAVTFNDTVNDLCMQMPYAMNVTGSPTTLTSTSTSGGAPNDLELMEFSGVVTSGALDVASSGTSTATAGTTATTQTITTTQNNDLGIACLSTISGQGGNITVSAGTGSATWTMFTNADQALRSGCAWAILPTTGNYSAVFNWTNSLPNGSVIVAYK